MRALGGTPVPGNADGALYPWDYWMMLSEFRCIWRGPRGRAGGVVTVPALFIHDRASIPGFAQGFIQKDGPIQRPSIVHDWVFVNKGVPGVETFEQANDFFFAGMKAEGAGRIARNLIYGAVNSDIGRAQWEDDD
jgi:hypothetical protein